MLVRRGLLAFTCLAPLAFTGARPRVCLEAVDAQAASRARFAMGVEILMETAANLTGHGEHEKVSKSVIQIHTLNNIYIISVYLVIHFFKGIGKYRRASDTKKTKTQPF